MQKRGQLSFLSTSEAALLSGLSDSRDINQDLALKPKNMSEAGLDYTLQTDGHEADADDRPDSEEIRQEMQHHKKANMDGDKEVMKAGMC